MLTEPFRDPRLSRNNDRDRVVSGPYETNGSSDETEDIIVITDDDPIDEKPESQPWLDIDFDLTPNHLVRLFNAMNKDRKSFLTYEETLNGLEIVNRSLPGYSGGFDREHAMQIVKICDMDKSHNISREEFVNVVQTFAMSYLLSEPTGEVFSFFCFDYDEERAQCRHIDPEAWDSDSAQTGTISFREFLEEDHTRPRYSESTVRWIHLSGNKVGTIITLGNKYGLHPLTLEDILNHDERPRLETNADGSTHLILSVLSPMTSADTKGGVSRVHAFKSTALKQKLKPTTKEEDTSTTSTMIRRGSKWLSGGAGDRTSSGPGRHSRSEQVRYRLQLFSHQLNVILVNDRTVLSFQKKPSDLLDPLLSRIAYHGSKIRMNNARFLVYSIIDKVIDGLFPVMKEYQRELRKLQTAVHSSKSTQLSTVKEVQHINREMNYAILWLKPMEGIVTKMLEHFSSDLELKRHLEDLKDHVQTLVDQANTMITWSQSLNDDYLNEQQCRMNQVMYVLTLVTTVFIPAQFLAGVYGMNFVYMPALNYHWGYFYFWAGIVCISVGVVAWFHKQGWIYYSD